MKASESLCLQTLETIQATLGLSEVYSEGDKPYTELTSPAFGEVGKVRVFKGKDIGELIYVGIVVPQIHLDSHMIFAFTPSGSAVPHFTLDSVAVPDGYAFHLDLIPRLDLGANLSYMDNVYGPLSPIFDNAKKIKGLSKAHISQRQVALMSPWMLVHRADDTAFDAIQEPVSDYLQHWLGLLEAGVEDATDPADLAARDSANRSAIFNTEVDPVWEHIERLLGAESSTAIRELLRLGSDSMVN
ncbi:MAG: hypothetical protein VX519_04475 [Myxococcota bacterium]|nr:hypothetical protein [Myxococcota bacterium]